MARVSQVQSGTRRLPIAPKLEKLLSQVADAAGVYFEVYSGGQDETTGYTGSTRHDHGNSADLRAFVPGSDGKPQYFSIDTPEGKQKWGQIATLSRDAGATGIGMAEGYMGPNAMHIGFQGEVRKDANGKVIKRPSSFEGVWGDGGKSANAPAWLRDAWDAGGDPRRVAQVKGQLSDPNLTPPANVPNSVPQPVQRPPELSGAVPMPRPRPLTALGSGMPEAVGLDATSILGWKNGESNQASSVRRAPMSYLETSRGRATADIYGVPDQRTMDLLQPKTPAGSMTATGTLGQSLGDTGSANLTALGAPTPMPRPAFTPPAATTPARQPTQPQTTEPAQQAPETPLARLPSGKMIAEGTYPSKNPGSSVTIKRGPDGNAIITNNKPGVFNLAKLGKDTVAGGFAGKMIGDKLTEAKDTVGTALTGLGSNVSGFAADAGQTVNNALGGIGAAFGNFHLGSAPTPPATTFTPATIAPSYRDISSMGPAKVGVTGNYAAKPVYSPAPMPRPAMPTFAPANVSRPPSGGGNSGGGGGSGGGNVVSLMGSSTGRSYQEGKLYSNQNGTFKAVAGPDGKAIFQKVS
jgi:hypothetical protein